jgi:hypothetical protein
MGDVSDLLLELRHARMTGASTGYRIIGERSAGMPDSLQSASRLGLRSNLAAYSITLIGATQQARWDGEAEQCEVKIHEGERRAGRSDGNSITLRAVVDTVRRWIMPGLDPHPHRERRDQVTAARLKRMGVMTCRAVR